MRSVPLENDDDDKWAAVDLDRRDDEEDDGVRIDERDESPTEEVAALWVNREIPASFRWRGGVAFKTEDCL